jgi:hypothetical protein
VWIGSFSVLQAAGVKVFVLLYKEVELAMGINSYYSKQRLVAASHSNIKVGNSTSIILNSLSSIIKLQRWE